MSQAQDDKENLTYGEKLKGGSSSYSYNVWYTAAEMNPTNEYLQNSKEWGTAHLEPGDEPFIKESAWKWDAYLEPSYKYKKCTRHAQTLHSIVNEWSLTPNTHNNPPWPSAQNSPPTLRACRLHRHDRC